MNRNGSSLALGTNAGNIAGAQETSPSPRNRAHCYDNPSILLQSKIWILKCSEIHLGRLKCFRPGKPAYWFKLTFHESLWVPCSCRIGRLQPYPWRRDPEWGSGNTAGYDTCHWMSADMAVNRSIISTERRSSITLTKKIKLGENNMTVYVNGNQVFWISQVLMVDNISFCSVAG